MGDEDRDQSLLPIDDAELPIRRVWHEGRWFFSVIDVVGALTGAPKPRMYWADMKRTIHAEGFVELLENGGRRREATADRRR